MKKILALLLALVMVFALVACGNKPPVTSDPGTTVKTADDIDDNMTSADGKYEVAFITDVGQLKDQSFNQGTYDGVKLFADANGKSYKYYQPANGDQATDDDRYDAMVAAVEGGAKVVVAAGFMQEAALKRAAETTLPVSLSRKSSPVTLPATLPLRKATPSWASPVVAAAPTPLAAALATAMCRAPMLLLLSWALPLTSATPGPMAPASPLLRSCRLWLTAGTPMALRSSLPAAVPCSPPSLLLLLPTTLW